MFSQWTVEIKGDLKPDDISNIFRTIKDELIENGVPHQSIKLNNASTDNKKSCKCKNDKSSLTSLVERMKRKKLYINSVRNEIADDFRYYTSLFEGNDYLNKPDTRDALEEAMENTVFRIDHLRDVCKERDLLQKKIDDLLNKINQTTSSSRCCK